MHSLVEFRLKIILVTIVLVFYVISMNQTMGNDDIRFIVYYGDYFPKICVAKYNVFILSLNSKGDITQITKNHLVAGYLSLGEVDSKQTYFEKINHQKFILHKNPIWPDARLVDVRDAAWHRFILDEMIPKLIEKGFNGLFLDTLDSIIALEQSSPDRYNGSIESLILLIQQIKQQYPDLKLIANNAFSILPQIDSLLEYVLAESLYTAYDFRENKYQLAKNDYRLKLVADVVSNLTSKCLVLEYAVESDMISKIREMNQAYKFPLFISNIQLTRGCPKRDE